MYRLFYNLKGAGDILFVLLNPEEKTASSTRSGRVEALLNQKGEVIGYNIFNISEILKIKASGMLLPLETPILSLINQELENAGQKPLLEEKDSHYKVALISKLEEHPIDEKAQIVTLKIGDKEYTTVSHYQNLVINEKVVVETDGCITYNGSVFHSFIERNIPSQVSICSPLELKMGDNQGAYIEEKKESGQDFFAE